MNRRSPAYPGRAFSLFWKEFLLGTCGCEVSPVPLHPQESSTLRSHSTFILVLFTTLFKINNLLDNSPIKRGCSKVIIYFRDNLFILSFCISKMYRALWGFFERVAEALAFSFRVLLLSHPGYIQ